MTAFHSFFLINPWKWKFENRLKYLYFGDYSKLRVVILFFRNMGLFIVNNFFFHQSYQYHMIILYHSVYPPIAHR